MVVTQPDCAVRRARAGEAGEPLPAAARGEVEFLKPQWIQSPPDLKSLLGTQKDSAVGRLELKEPDTRGEHVLKNSQTFLHRQPHFAAVRVLLFQNLQRLFRLESPSVYPEYAPMKVLLKEPQGLGTDRHPQAPAARGEHFGRLDPIVFRGVRLRPPCKTRTNKEDFTARWSRKTPLTQFFGRSR